MNLAKGSTGPQVRQLQGFLNRLPQTRIAALKEDGVFGVRTDTRVREFQGLNFLAVDGIVGTLTMAAINAALSILKDVIPPSPSSLVITQKNAAALTAAHTVSVPIVQPAVTATPPRNFRFAEWAPDAAIHEFLFEIKKAGTVFWVGAAVPTGTVDFTRAYLFFHPTVRQAGHVVAEDDDYPEFKGGWSTVTRPVGSIQRYVALEGAQLAWAGLKIPMLVPFTTMAALSNPSANMFSDRPVELLTTVLEAIQNELAGRPTQRPTIAKLGAASFSSGITALRSFLSAMTASRLVKEVIDFDSPFISREPKALTRSPGATSKCFTQKPPAHPQAGYVTVTKEHFKNVSAYGHLPDAPINQRLHARIGWMMFHQAMANSVIK